MPLTQAQATILSRMAEGRTLTRSLVSDRLWSLLEDPFTVFDDLSPRRLLAAGHIALAREGSLEADRADSFQLTEAGRRSLEEWRSHHAREGGRSVDAASSNRPARDP